MSWRGEKVIKVLKDNNASDDIVQAVTVELAKTFPPQVYKTAVWFLGSVTTVLVLGAITLTILNKTPSEALWTAVGAGIGALAGIFTAQATS
jgi:hypothetical protein